MAENAATLVGPAASDNSEQLGAAPRSWSDHVFPVVAKFADAARRFPANVSAEEQDRQFAERE